MRLNYGWVVVAAGALMGCVAIGAVFSLAVFLQPMSDATGWSRTGISTAMTIVFVTMGFAAFGWGALTDRFGPRSSCWRARLLLGAGPRAGEPRHQPARIPAGLRRHRRRRGRRGLRADDRHGDRLVRQAPQPRGLAGVGRHGHGADDDLALRELADHEPTTGAPRSSCIAIVAWVLLVPAALSGAPARRYRPAHGGAARAPSPRSRHDGRAGAALAAVHRPGRHLFLLLRHALRPDLPYGELRHRLRHRPL